jgi:L-phenylalanine/L-methionine N-acetyltransferase
MGRSRTTGRCRANGCMPDIYIRAAESTDAEALHEIFNCPGVIANTMQLPWQSLEKRRAWLSGHLGAESHLLVAEIDRRVVGNLGLDLFRAMRRRHVASMGMSVHDDFQNRGVGNALLKAMTELADDWLGLERIELEVFVDNLGAIHLYEKYGFTKEGVGRRFARRAGGFVDAYYMGRLRPPGTFG